MLGGNGRANDRCVEVCGEMNVILLEGGVDCVAKRANDVGGWVYWGWCYCSARFATSVMDGSGCVLDRCASRGERGFTPGR